MNTVNHFSLSCAHSVASKSLDTIVEDTFSSLGKKNKGIGLILRVLSPLTEEEKSIARQQLEGRKWMTADEICLLIAQFKEDKDKGSITREQFGHLTASLKRLLPVVLFQGRIPKGKSRKNENAIPTGFGMLDFDHIEMPPEEMYAHVRSQLEKAKLWELVAAVHKSPSCEGLHLVYTIPRGMDVEQSQRWLSGVLGAKYDPACKDLARCSFVVPSSYYYYLRPDILFADHTDPEKAPDVSASAGTIVKSEPAQEEKQPVVEFATRPVLPLSVQESEVEAEGFRGISPLEPPMAMEETESDDTAYLKRLMELARVRWMEMYLKGEQPVEGERHHTILRMAQDLASFYHPDEGTLEAVLPDFEKSRSEVRGIVAWVMEHPKTSCSGMMREVARQAHEDMAAGLTLGDILPFYGATAPRLPEEIPSLLEKLTEGIDPVFHPAVITASMPAFAEHLYNVVFFYCVKGNSEPHHAVLMSCLVAPSSSGKSCVDAPIRAITADIQEADQKGWDEDTEWRLATSKLGKNSKQPAKPKPVIRCIMPDITIPKLMEAADAAGKYMLYLTTSEIEELLNMSKGNPALFYTILKKSPDFYAKIGQMRSSAEATMVKTKVELCISASTTPGNCRKFFRNEQDSGVTHRFVACTLPPRRIGADMPQITPKPGLGERIKPYIDRLNALRDIAVAPSAENVTDDLKHLPVVECPKLRELSEKLNEELRHMADLSLDPAVESFRTRAVVHAYLSTCVLLAANGMKWEDSFEDFARWYVLHDMWCKLRLFGSQLRATLELDNNLSDMKPVASTRALNTYVLSQLPQTFTDPQLVKERLKVGMDGNTKNFIANCLKCGRIKRVSPGTYTKLK